MKQSLLTFSLFVALALFAAPVNAQWQCLYATYDDTTNGTGENTTAVGVFSENNFVALVMTRGTRNYMVPFKNADSAVGRLYYYGYGSGVTANVFQLWTDGGFDQVQLNNAFKLATTPDGMIYVANNDPEHNILVFRFQNDTIKAVSPFRRQPTGTNPIFGIEVDTSGYVYVCNDTTSGKTDDIKVYPPLAQWTDAHDNSPVAVIDLPDGIYKGITVTPDGHSVFVSDYGNRKILKYVGSQLSGYTADANFNFSLTAADTIVGTTSLPSLLGLAYKSPNNILFAASDWWLGGGTSYSWGRIYLINASTGALASTDSSVSIIDAAKWNFDLTGGYNLRTNGTVPGNASGYTSTYDVELDNNGNVYSQSHYGWTVEKWAFTGTLPVLTAVEEVRGKIPSGFHLSQNYPNPFNPTTVISFQVPVSGKVSLKVVDVLGREVALLVDEFKNAGSYRVTFDAGNLPTGTYFCTLRGGNLSETMKMILLK